MRALKWFSDFAAWRWAPTVGLIGATLFYIVLVLLLVPGEVGLPGVNAKFVPRSSLGHSSGSDAGAELDLANRASVPTATATHHEPAPSPPPPPPAPVEVPRRGFSPPLERVAEAAAAAVAAPPPPAPEAPPAPAPEPAAAPAPPPEAPPPSDSQAAQPEPEPTATTAEPQAVEQPQ